MTIPSEIAWIVPFILPFVIGLLAGAIIRRMARLILLVVALVIVLSAAGYVSIGMQDIYDRAMEVLPRLINTGQGVKDAIPYTSTAFLLGLALGLWQG